MDRLDKISAGALIVLLIWALVLILSYHGSAPRRMSGGRRALPQAARNPDLTGKIKTVKNLLAAGNPRRAMKLTDLLQKDYPYEGEVYMLKGDVMLHLQRPIAAMRQYRQAVDLNPDFLDRNTSLFRGEQIKNTVAEAQTLIEREVKAGSAKAAGDKQVLYYMLRKIAGGCG
ncbi:hypothetical protein ACOHYD_11570 [Desulfobacterota bacterium M19]